MKVPTIVKVGELPNLLLVVICMINATANSQPCAAQVPGYPNSGFRSYCNGGYRNTNTGFGTPAPQNSFNSGLSGLSRTSTGYGYSTQRSSMAAQQLARQIGNIWSRTPVGRSMMAPEQGTGSVQQSSQGMGGMFPRMTKQEVMRIFFEGGTPQSMGGGAPGPSAGSSQATSTAYSNYQTAENESSKAYNYAQRVRYSDTDTWSRKDDASNAEYAAQNANYAAERAESAAYNGDSEARGYANLARQAANRARSNADQARYNADTMH